MTSESIVITLMLCISSFLVGTMFSGYMQAEHERAAWRLMEEGERIFDSTLALFDEAIKERDKE